MTFCQTVAQVCQTVSRVGQGLLAQTLICRQNLCKVGQFFCKYSVLTLLGSRKQRLRCDCTGFALVDQPQRLLQQLRLVCQTLPRTQPALHTARRLLQGQKLTCRRQHLLCQSADLREHTVSQS